jgi:hypothetical protein
MGLFDFLGSKKDSGRDAGNALQLSAEDQGLAQGQLKNLLNFQSNSAATDPLQSSRTATSEVQNNPILSKLFGNGGAMDRADTEEQNLASRGYSMQPEDYEAYGQASGQIARNFDQADAGLAQALSNRGLSSSGVAGQGFMSNYGNKLEQLGQLQTQIAQNRMAMNQQRLQATRSFMSQLGAQGEGAINDQFGRQQSAEKLGFGELQDKNSAAQSRLQAAQNQGNENLKQRAGTEQQQMWASAVQGLGNTGEQAGMAYATGGLSGLSGGGGSPTNQSGSTVGMPSSDTFGQNNPNKYKLNG